MRSNGPKSTNVGQQNVDDTSVLDIFLTAGGLFDMEEHKPDRAVKLDTTTIVGYYCENDALTYHSDPPGADHA